MIQSYSYSIHLLFHCNVVSFLFLPAFCFGAIHFDVQKQLETLAVSCAIHQRRDPEEQDNENSQATHIGNSSSGTDSPVIWAHRMGMRHVFSCEFCDKKQKWIAENFPDLEFLFKDIKTLKDTEQASLLDDRLEEGPLYPRGCGPVFRDD